MKIISFDNTIGFLIGVLGSLAASFLISLNQGAPLLLSILILIAFLSLLSYFFAVRKKISVLKTIGIKSWEPSPVGKHTTKSCIVRSQTRLRFFGITSNKWIREEDELEKMLKRHASNGGGAEFLLLNPESEHAEELEKIKPDGEVREDIRKNARKLLSFKDRYQVEVRFYSYKARFRVVILDDNEIIVGLYSYMSQKGKEETPQLVLEKTSKDWSFYYGFNAYFQNAWDDSVDAESIIQ